MKNTKHEFWVLDELITMPERKHANAIVAILWDVDGNVDQGIMNQLIALIVPSTCEEWRREFPILVEQLLTGRGLKIVEIDHEHKCGVVDKLVAVRPLNWQP